MKRLEDFVFSEQVEDNDRSGNYNQTFLVCAKLFKVKTNEGGYSKNRHGMKKTVF